VLDSITAHKKSTVTLTAARSWDLGKLMSDGHDFKESALSLLPGRRRNGWNVYAITHFTQYVTVTESKYCPLVTWPSFHLILSAPLKRRSISKRLHAVKTATIAVMIEAINISEASVNFHDSAERSVSGLQSLT
jgi:hypothetical protein